MVFSLSLDKPESCHPEPFDRLRVNSAKDLYHAVEDPPRHLRPGQVSVALERFLTPSRSRVLREDQARKIPTVDFLENFSIIDLYICTNKEQG